MSGALALDRIPARILARIRAAGPLSPEFPERDRPGLDTDPHRFDRALAESSSAALVLRFEVPHLPASPAAAPSPDSGGLTRAPARGSEADDLDRLRLELESTLLRIPVLRAQPLDRIELRLDAEWPGGDLSGFLRQVRASLPGAASAAVFADLAGLPGGSAIDCLAAAGCSRANFRGVDPRELSARLPLLRTAGFRAITAELGGAEICGAAGLLGGAGLDGVGIRSPLGDLRAPDDALRERIRAAHRASIALRAAGFVDTAPRRYLREGALPGFEPYAESKTKLGIGPGALRVAGAPMDLRLWRSGADRAAWAEAIDHGRIPPGTGHRPSEEERLRRFIIRSLLGTGRVDIVQVERRGRIDFIHRFESELAALDERQHDGLVECDMDEIRATEIGRLLIEDLAGCFDPSRLEREREPSC